MLAAGPGLGATQLCWSKRGAGWRVTTDALHVQLNNATCTHTHTHTHMAADAHINGIQTHITGIHMHAVKHIWIC